MELSILAVEQHHGQKVKLKKKLYHRNKRLDSHGTKRMWVDRMLDLSCDFKLWPHPWPWPWIFKVKFLVAIFYMMTSSNGNIFRVTGPLCGEFTGPGEFPTQRSVTRSFDVFFDLRLNKRLNKQPQGWWFETPVWSLWRHRNVGMGRSIDLEWKRCELNTMSDAQWACSWATVHGKYIGQIMGRCETVTVSNLLVHECMGFYSLI